MSTTHAIATENCPPPDRLAGRVPFFYGYLMLPVAMAAMVASTPGQTFAVAVFNPSLRESLGISASQLAGAYLLGTLLGSIPVAYVGAMMDRHGIRRSMAVVVGLFGAACLLMSQVSGLVSLTITFLFLRMLGQGALTLLASNTLAMWFHTRLGRVSGLMSLGMPCAIATAPLGILWLIQQFGWRWTYVILGLIVWSVMFPLLALVFRNRPEDIGQQPDGLPNHDDSSSPIPIATARPAHSPLDGDWSPAAAIRCRPYWILLAAFSAWAMIATALMFHVIPLMAVRGMDKNATAATFTTFAISLAVMQLLGGVLVDRLPLNVLLSVAMAGMTAGVVILTIADSALLVHLYVMIFGAAQGLASAVGSTIWVRYFGRRHLGKIRGSVWTVTIAGSSFGPFLAGLSFDHLGSFDPSLWLFAGIFAALVPLVLLATKPVHPSHSFG